MDFSLLNGLKLDYSNRLLVHDKFGQISRPRDTEFLTHSRQSKTRAELVHVFFGPIFALASVYSSQDRLHAPNSRAMLAVSVRRNRIGKRHCISEPANS